MSCTLLFASPSERERRVAVEALGEEQVVLASSTADLLLALPMQPEVVVLRIDLPGLSSSRLLTRILSQPNPPAVLLAVAEEERKAALELAKAGANGWLMRPMSAEVLA